MFTCARKVGRLVEVRLITPLADDEVDQFIEALGPLFVRGSGRCIGISDLRAARVFPEGQAERFVELLRRDNPMIERSAFLIDNSATFGLQIARMTREAQNPMRRVFTDPDRATAWLDEALTTEEQARLRHFLATHDLEVARARGEPAG